MTPLQLLNIFLAMLFSSLLCYSLANKKGRNPLLWGMIGFCFSFLGIGLFFLTDILLRKKNERLTIMHPMPPPSPPVEEQWYYIDQAFHQIGPVALRDLNTAWEQSHINENSYIWKAGMQEWKKIKETPEIKEELVGKP